MFSGFVNIWNYFSENVTALRMRDNCWGVTQRFLVGDCKSPPAISSAKTANVRFLVHALIEFDSHNVVMGASLDDVSDATTTAGYLILRIIPE